MIAFEKFSFGFPQKELYNNITFSIDFGEHCALIGVSGSGKSTLVDLMMYPDRYTYDGTMKRQCPCTIGYISQFPDQSARGDTTVYDFIAANFHRVERELDELCQAMEHSEDVEPLLEEYQAKLDEFEAMGGNDFERNAKSTLNLSGLMAYKDQPVAQLSGGEFKLVQVMKAMLTPRDLLIMDEPDVFLDFENVNGLRHLINSYKGTLLVITHNRYLLNHCFNKILHLENKELQAFEGNYTDYNFALLQNKIELKELAQRDSDELERNLALIERLRSSATDTPDPAKGRALYARVKIHERLMARRVRAPFLYSGEADIRLHTDLPNEGGQALAVTEYRKYFDGLLLDHVNFAINHGEKVAIIGKNGAGKTTLLRDIYRNDNQAIAYHDGVEVAYLAQNQSEMLDEESTVMDEFLKLGFETYDEVIEYLANYGFVEDVLEQTIGDFSGGEKNILQLAKICTTNANLLLLDEPTSHLDTYAQIALENAIKNYNGTVLMISHDFYTIVNAMDYVLLVEDKTIRKVRIRKFRQMMYESYFDKDYLQKEQSKKTVEERIEKALKANDFTLAKSLATELENLIATL